MLKSNTKQTVNVTLNKDVTPEKVQATMAAIFRAHGCNTCGLIGVDVNLHGSPVESVEIGSVPGVHSVEVSG